MIFVLTLTIPAEWPVIVPECHFKTHEVDFSKTNYKKLMKRIELKAKGTGMLKLVKNARSGRASATKLLHLFLKSHIKNSGRKSMAASPSPLAVIQRAGQLLYNVIMRIIFS